MCFQLLIAVVYKARSVNDYFGPISRPIILALRLYVDEIGCRQIGCKNLPKKGHLFRGFRDLFALELFLSFVRLGLFLLINRTPYLSRHIFHVTKPHTISLLFLIVIMMVIAVASTSKVGIKARAKRALASMLLRDLQMLNDMEDAILKETLGPSAKKKKLSKVRRKSARQRRFRERKSWAMFKANLTDRQFRRYFRMSKDCFESLCDSIIENVGKRQFKSEAYLSEFKGALAGNDLRSTNITRAHDETTGGFISGEIKLALTLRILGGGSYLDLAILFETGFSYPYEIFHDVINNWILDDKLVKINGIDYCCDDERMKEVALQFARSSNGVLNGCIGALDGWIVKIIRPSKRDKVRNPKSFYSHKVLFGINVQAIVDKKKRILFRSILSSSRGAEHDSTAFKSTSLYSWLLWNSERMAR